MKQEWIRSWWRPKTEIKGGLTVNLWSETNTIVTLCLKIESDLVCHKSLNMSVSFILCLEWLNVGINGPVAGIYYLHTMLLFEWPVWNPWSCRKWQLCAPASYAAQPVGLLLKKRCPTGFMCYTYEGMRRMAFVPQLSRKQNDLLFSRKCFSFSVYVWRVFFFWKQEQEPSQYNFSVYKHSHYRWQKRVLQVS